MVATLTCRMRVALAPILLFFLTLLPAAGQDAASVSALGRGLELMRAGEWDAALAAAGPSGSVAQDIVQWNRLRNGKGTFAETRAFLARRPDWPGLSLLRKRSETTIPEDASHAAVLDFFLNEKPQTGTGSLRFAKALWETGAKDAAMAEAIRAWTTLSLDDEEYQGFRVDWPKTTAAHHVRRLDMLLWRGLTGEAEKMLDLVDGAHQRLARARIALRDDKPGVDALIEAVPAVLADDPGLAYERFLWRARKGRNDDAIELMLARSTSAASLGDPAAWGNWRAVLARWAMREGKARTAYRLASSHHIDDGDERNDLEWLAGYIALRKLDDAETALRHFHSFKGGVETPISLGRAGYWEGRALEALGRADEARAAYTRGGQHQTSFYGLLAAEKAGLAMDTRLTGKADIFPNHTTAPFWNTDIMEAARLSWAAGETYLTERFTVHLSERLDRTGVGQLTAWAEAVDAPHIQLMLSKYALIYHGELFHRPYFPTPDIGRGNRTVPRALEMAISRRESEFDPKVVSGAGAMGLMQLMPGTAKDMARRVDIAYEQGRLTSDMGYNTRLGSEYLAYLIEEFGRNPVLIAVAYNAGPSRARSWSEKMGDPRSPGTDIVDWIEHIPFNETRNYVMRVTESLPVYRARLTGETEAIAFSQELQRR